MVPFQKPSITGLWTIASRTNGQLNAGLKINRWRNMSASTAMIAIATFSPDLDHAGGFDVSGNLLTRSTFSQRLVVTQRSRSAPTDGTAVKYIG